MAIGMSIPAVVILSIILVAFATSADARLRRFKSYHQRGTNIRYHASIRPPMKKPNRNHNHVPSRAREFLVAHNKIRMKHKQPLLQWSKLLAKQAKQFALRRKVDCRMIHSNGQYGENIFWASHHKNWTPSKIVEEWASESKLYDAARNKCTQKDACGHYTQLVWLDTTQVGCAMAKCYNNGLYAICYYNPPGNYKNESPFVKHT